MSAAAVHAPADGAWGRGAGRGAADVHAGAEHIEDCSRGLPPPMQLPLQPLTRLVAFDDALADLVSEVDTMLESQSGGHGRGSLREGGGQGPWAGDDSAECWGMQRLKEWVSGQTGACVDANAARGVPDVRPSRLSGGGGGSVAEGPCMHEDGQRGPPWKTSSSSVEDALPRRHGAVETLTRAQNPVGVRVDCRSRNDGEAGRLPPGQRRAYVGRVHDRCGVGGNSGSHPVHASVPYAGGEAGRQRPSGRGGSDNRPSDRVLGGGPGCPAADNARVVVGDHDLGSHGVGGGHGVTRGNSMHDGHAYVTHASRSSHGGVGRWGFQEVQGGWAETERGSASEAVRGYVERGPGKVGRGALLGSDRERARPRGNADAQDDAVLSILNDLF